MTDNQNAASSNDRNQQKPRKKNNNYYRKKKNYSYNKQYSNQPKDTTAECVCPEPAVVEKSEDSESKKVFQNKGYNNYKRYNKERRISREAVETTDDIKKDILRIEKEIRLEIEEIKMIRV